MGRYNRYIPKDPEMTVNTEVKGTLAKLLATENLIVEHRKITTAYFDVEKRLLALPIWKDVTGDVYDLLVGHETGHALYTPAEDFGTAPKDYVNVLEDARVERKMKVTYPGLRKSFHRGYSELNDRDFFGIKDTDISKLNLIDRINIHFKIGVIDNRTVVPFTAEELVWVNRVAETVTFADVVTLAEELYAYAKDQQKQEVPVPPVPSPPSSPQGSNQAEEYDPPSNSQTEETSDDGESTNNDSNSDLDEGDFDSAAVDYEPVDSAAISKTERAWNESQNTLVDDDAKEWIYLDLPKIDLDEVIVPWKVIQKNLTDYFSDNLTDRIEYTYHKYEEYKKSSQKSVNYLVKQFEMKKSADAYARASQSRTGVLNTNKLHNYKLTEDIFKKVTTIPDGKNHGLIFQLDWSGSMQTCMMDTLRQLYNLVWFCKKVQIPFEVYAFQSYDGSRVPKESCRDINTVTISSDFYQLQLFSSKMNNKQLDNQMRLVWAQCWGMCGTYGGHGYYGAYSLGSTPLVEAAITTRQIVSRFKTENQIQKVNVVCLTDGESNPLRFNVRQTHSDRYGDYWITDYLCHHLYKVFILRDPVTGYQRKLSHSTHRTTSDIVSFMREVTDYNWIGFRLCSKTEATRVIREFFEFHESEKLISTWSKEKFIEVRDRLGFDVQYFMPNHHIGSGTEDLEVKQKSEVATKAELQRAFKKHMGSKMTNKTLLNKFVEMIA